MRNNIPIGLWTIVTTVDTFLQGGKMPISIIAHHLFGLVTTISILTKQVEQHRYRFYFVFLEIGLLSTKFVKYCNYSVESLWLHVLVHVLVRWPILQKGSRIAHDLGYTWLGRLGPVFHILDVYWFYRLMLKSNQICNHPNNNITDKESENERRV